MPNRPFLPIATCLLTLAALAVACAPGATELLQLDWAAVASGEIWRLWTGHFAHWTPSHLFWDVLTFFALGVLCERESRRAFLVAVGAGVPAISWGLATLCPDVLIYRGLSGIDTGLFVWIVLIQLRDSRTTRQGSLTLLWSALLGGLAGKLIYEGATGNCLFVSTSPDTFRPLVESHLLGAFVGGATYLGAFVAAPQSTGNNAGILLSANRLTGTMRLALNRTQKNPRKFPSGG